MISDKESIKLMDEAYIEAYNLNLDSGRSYFIDIDKKVNNDRYVLETLKLFYDHFNEYRNLKHLWSFIIYYYIPKNRMQCFELMLRKRKDYGIEPLLITGQIGIMVRVISKVCRLINLQKNELEPNNESIEDNKNDIFNYAIIAMQMLRGDLK